VINRYSIAAAAVIFLVILSYFINFFVLRGYGVSGDPAIWGQLGDYLGGVLNPILSFISIILLIKSLTLQYEANQSLRDELKNSEKTEKMRSFEILFFNMISAQKSLFESFEIENGANTDSDKLFFMKKTRSLWSDFGKAQSLNKGVEGVFFIEDEIQRLRDNLHDDESIMQFLYDLDSKDQIYGVVRAFYILVKIITDKLSNAQGFEIEDRKEHLHALINFTDFAQLRLVLIAVQFMNFESAKYLKKHREFNDVLLEVGLLSEKY